MQDPALTLVAMLSTGWALASPLDDPRFSTGWYDKAFDNLQVTVTPIPGGDNSAQQLGMRGVRVWKRYDINAWVKAENETNKGVGQAKQFLWSFQEEIKRLVKHNKTGLTDLNWLLPGPEGQFDEPDETPPLFRWLYTVIVGYTV